MRRPRYSTSQGSSPLLVAVETGSTACLRVLLQEGADPHGPNEAGDTPLHLAVGNKSLFIPDLLRVLQNKNPKVGFTDTCT